MIRFRTVSGSRYTLDPSTRKWTSTSISTRTSEGTYTNDPVVKVGHPVILIGPGLMFGTRIIETTPVTRIEE